MDVELTELEKLEVTRVDAVGRPANGFPVLLMKGVAAPVVVKGERDCPKCDKSYDADHAGAKCENCGTSLPDAPASKAEFDREGARAAVKAIVGRKVDEAPDIAGGTAVLAQIADLIIAEAQELKSGQAGEIGDIQQLACAAEMIWCWRTGEESAASGSVMPATALMQSAAEAVKMGFAWTPEMATEFIRLAKDRNYSAAERKEMAGDGRALPDGSYPINDEHDLNSAAILARSGHGDAAAATKHIGKRAKELGVANPLGSSDDTAKSEIAKEGTDVDTVTQTGDLEEVVKAADAKAAALEKRIAEQDSVIKAFEGRLAKVEAAPVLGGPVMSAVRPKTGPDGEDHARKAAYYEDWADRVSRPEDADRYRQLAAQERAKITS
jgi:hypothetical protein